MKSLIHEIHRRSLWQVLGIYLVGAWIALQVVEQLAEAAGLPEWVRPLALVLLIIGFPIVMATAFVQEGLGPGDRGAAGLKTSSEASPSNLQEDLEAPARDGRAHHRVFTWRNAILGGLAAFALLGLLTAGYMAMRLLGIGPAGTLVAKGLLDERSIVILTDFTAADSSLARAATEAFRVDLSQSQIVRLAEPSFLQGALRRMQVSVDRLDQETGREVAIREGLPTIIGGEINPAGPGFVLTAQLVKAETGEVLASQRETAADASEIIDAIDQLSKRLRERIGESFRTIRAEAPLARVTTGDLDALRKYSQAVQAIEVLGDDERGIVLLEEALRLDPEFAMAWRKLGVTFGNRFQERSREVEALTQAFEHRDRLPERERYLAMAAYYDGVTREQAKSITAYENLLDLNPDDDWALNNLGIQHNENRDFERAAELFERAIGVDSTLLPPYFNLTVSRLDLGDSAGVWSVLERGRRNVPGNPQIAQLSALASAAQGDRDGALRYAEEIEQEFGGDPFWMGWVSDARAAIAGARGRLAEAREHRAGGERLSLERGVPALGLSVALGEAWSTLLVREQAEASLALADEALARYPLADLAPLDRPYEELVRLHAFAGDAVGARVVLDEFRAEVPEELRSDRQMRRSKALLALAGGDDEAAIAGFRAADEGLCLSCTLPGLARAYERAGQPDSAIAVYTRLAERPWPGKMFFDRHLLGPSLERLAELYDERGDLDDAALYYARLVELWAEADEELQPRVRAAQARLEEILRERG